MTHHGCATLAGVRSRRPISAFGPNKRCARPYVTICEQGARRKRFSRKSPARCRAITMGGASLKACVPMLTESQAILRLAETRQGRIPQPVYVSLARASCINDSLGHEFAHNRRLPSVAKFFTSRVEGRTHDARVGVVEYDPRPKWQN